MQSICRTPQPRQGSLWIGLPQVAKLTLEHRASTKEDPMKRSLTCLLLLVLSAPVGASGDCPDVEALNALYGVRELVIRDAPSYTISSEIDDQIERLREPLPGGGYRWVRLVRPADGEGPFDKTRHFVRSASVDSPDIFEAEAANAWAVSIVVPRKRSLFHSNKESWVGDATITCTVEGRTETRRESIQRWMKPDTKHTVDLGGAIADSCRVRVETATRTEFLDEEALVEVHIREAVEEDDPDNPNAEAIRILRKIRYSASPETLDYEIAKLERRLFPNLYSYPFATLLAETREAQKLLASEKEDDQKKGREKLEEVVKDLEKR